MNENMEPMIYSLVDEDGNELNFELLDEMEVDGETYFAMTPYIESPDEQLAEDAELIVLKAKTEDGEELMITVDNEEEYEKVGNLFIERFESLFEDQEEEE